VCHPLTAARRPRRSSRCCPPPPSAGPATPPSQGWTGVCLTRGACPPRRVISHAASFNVPASLSAAGLLQSLPCTTGGSRGRWSLHHCRQSVADSFPARLQASRASRLAAVRLGPRGKGLSRAGSASRPAVAVRLGPPVQPHSAPQRVAAARVGRGYGPRWPQVWPWPLLSPM
jgi:hypothetical protein